MAEGDFLAHYGVPGMKWGKRKNPRPRSQDAAKVARLRERAKSNGLQSLENKEIQKVNDRLQLEKKYKDLNPSVISKGQAKVAIIVGVAGTAAAVYSLKDNPVVKIGVNAIKKAATKG